MCKKSFKSEEIDERKYNFIISNLILSQEDSFTYDDIIEKLENMFDEITTKIESVLERCLIRLREDGFLNILGSSYCVVDAKI